MRTIDPLRIRPATAGDSQLIRTTIKRAKLDPTGLDWRRFKIAENAAGAMVGICQVRHYWGLRELGSLFVEPRHRGEGIGGTLVRACLADQPPPVYLECAAARQGYYERHGFQRISLWRAPLGLRLKSLVGTTGAWLFYRHRLVVMRWDG